MAQLVYFCDGADERIVIDTQDMTKERLEKEYEATVSDIFELKDDDSDRFSHWPADRILEPLLSHAATAKKARKC